MDFFRAQDNARRTSRWLVWWFMLCVLGVVTVLYLLAVLGANWVGNDAPSGREPFGWFHPELFLGVLVGIGGLIVAGSLYKLVKLSAGGHVVAQDLGGREVDLGTRDFHERRLLNVVEEMSIAAGLPMPGVWVMDNERGINAFAAGTDPANAVVGVTRGTLEKLSRDELQGVIAHEFSHILNGDMRLNMRLTGWIYGLLMVVILGRLIMEMAGHLGRGRSKEAAGGALIALGVGVAVWLVGTVGAFFARWLQAAVSRQREYLADASAVQFTRNPVGLADALRKVGGASRGGAVRAAAASEARHLFFAKSDLMGLSLSTHPPLDRRIQAIFPQWDGTMLETKSEEMNDASPEAAAHKGFPGMPPPLPGSGGGLHGHDILGPVLGAMAASAASHPQGGSGISSKDDAKALVHGLLLSPDVAMRLAGVDAIAAAHGRPLALRAVGWGDRMRELSSAGKLAWLDQSLAWLRSMDPGEATSFIQTNRSLIEADGEVDLFEFMLEQVIDRHVAIATGLREVSPVRHRTLDAVEREVAVWIGLFRSIGGEGAEELARQEYREHTRRELPELHDEACSLTAAAEALPELDAATPLVKQQFLRMCGLVVNADGVTEDHEVELLRAVAEAIGAPMPRARFDG